MAHTKQARKRIRQTETHTQRNREVKSRVHNFIRKFEEAVKSGEKEAIGTAFKNVMSELHRAARKGVMKKETASRKISRLAARIRSAA